MSDVVTLIDVDPNIIMGTVGEDLWAGFWRLYDLSRVGSYNGLHDNNSEISAIAQTLVNIAPNVEIIHVQIHNATTSEPIQSDRFPSLYPDIDLDNIGELPAYSYFAFADMQVEETVINSIALSYDSERDAKQAAEVVAERLAYFDVKDYIVFIM